LVFTTALAYYETYFITVVKCFIEQTPVWKFIPAPVDFPLIFKTLQKYF
jgi:hypothetical protein